MRAGWMKSSFPPLPEWTQVDSHCTSIGLSSGSSMIQRFWLGATPVPVLGPGLGYDSLTHSEANP